MTNKIELLAPAGNYDAFTAAVESGADAVYLGGRLFNARQFAGNFDNEQLKKALDYAHVRDVKIYLAMNTLIADNEMEEAVNLAGEAYEMGIDGIIVQDLGFAGIIRKLLPDLDLHASTQMTTYNIGGVEVLKEFGFKRVVLARELTLAEIEQIARNTDLEIEVFIHGALCISYSGQCLMSSMIGGRSGNRGKCAQPCRLPYELVREGGKAADRITKGYLVSPKDLCSIDDIQRIIMSGVKSLKIEGRMKTPEYVGTVVRTYRKYIDQAIQVLEKESGKTIVSDIDKAELAQIFNRGGLSSGYLHGKNGSDMMCYEKPKNWGIHVGEIVSYDKITGTAKVILNGNLSIGDGVEIWNGEEESPGTIVTSIRVGDRNVREAKPNDTVVIGSLKGKIFKGNKLYKTSDKALNEKAKETLSGKFYKRVPVFGKIILLKDKPVVFKVEDSLGNIVEITSGVKPETALNKALTEERVLEQLKKTGSTPFDFKKVDIELDKNIAVPVSELNNLRRRALEELESKRAGYYLRQPDDKHSRSYKVQPNHGNKKADMEKGLSLFLYRFDKSYKLHELDIKRLYIPLAAIDDPNCNEVLSNIKKNNIEVYMWLPSITRGKYESLIADMLESTADSEIDGFLVGSLGYYNKLKKADNMEIAADYTLNIFNSFTISELVEIGIKGITLSPELTIQQIDNLEADSNIVKEAIIYGRLPLMVSEYCAVGSIAGGMSSTKICNAACLKATYKLKDRMGMEFPVLCDRTDCRSTILNSNVIFVAEQMDKIKSAGVNRFRINMTDESFEEIKDIVNMHNDILKNGTNISGKYSGLINRIKNKGFTKGHFFRGV